VWGVAKVKILTPCAAVAKNFPAERKAWKRIYEQAEEPSLCFALGESSGVVRGHSFWGKI